MAKLVSKTYGDALFDLSVEENSVDAMMQEVLAVRKAFEENPELARVLRNPDIGKEEKLNLVEKMALKKVLSKIHGTDIEKLLKEYQVI